MALFADYEPRKGTRGAPEPPAGLLIRAASAADLPALASLSADRQGISPDKELPAFEERLRRMQDGVLCLQVAELPSTGLPCTGRPGSGRPGSGQPVSGQPVAYGVAGLFDPGPDAPPHSAPRGWHLQGVVVLPEARRQGIGHALVASRLAWLDERDPVSWYVVSERNRASIDLHARFGFVEVTRNFTMPGVRFTGGVGLLLRRDST